MPGVSALCKEVAKVYDMSLLYARQSEIIYNKLPDRQMVKEKKISSYQKLKLKIRELNQDKKDLKNEIYDLISGDALRAGPVVMKYQLLEDTEKIVWYGRYETTQ